MERRNEESLEGLEDIPRQTPISWAVAMMVSWGSLRRRLFRSLITMVGVVLAIAFLTYMLVTNDITTALVRADVDALNVLLQKAGIDIFQQAGTDSRMILLISLSLFTCLVGIINAMLMSVTERVREIGTMKCLGALNTFILKIYLIEASLQGIIGTLIGMVVGVVVGMVVSVSGYGSHVIRHFPAGEVAQSLGIAVVVGSIISVVAALAPAQWAAAKEPVEAMRTEE